MGFRDVVMLSVRNERVRRKIRSNLIDLESKYLALIETALRVAAALTLRSCRRRHIARTSRAPGVGDASPSHYRSRRSFPLHIHGPAPAARSRRSPPQRRSRRRRSAVAAAAPLPPPLHSRRRRRSCCHNRSAS